MLLGGSRGAPSSACPAPRVTGFTRAASSSDLSDSPSTC